MGAFCVHQELLKPINKRKTLTRTNQTRLILGGKALRKKGRQ